MDSLTGGGEVGREDHATNVLDDENDDGEEVVNDDVCYGDYDGVDRNDVVHHLRDDVIFRHRHGEDDDDLLVHPVVEEVVVVLNDGVSWDALEQQSLAGARAFHLELRRS